MQIGSALTSYAQQGNGTSPDSGWQNRGANGASQDPQILQLAETAVPTQDAAVSISAEGAAAAARDGAATSDATLDASSQPDASPVKSFTYGTLGLERPDKPEEETNGYYTAGRWLAAGITLGGLIALVA
ncbi:hypothetical protein [Trinickia sp. EG282A]|uniref:hypothetical protein n=1 Tax=Trinickia sp. EG282A TaxID=3237013 RepID=UPI0034D308BC